jgi:hypothetical protein
MSVRWGSVVLATHLVGCAAGTTTSASSPEAFSIAPGTTITLHLRNGKDVTGEYSRHDQHVVTLDSGRVIVARARVRSVQTHEDFRVEPQGAIDAAGNPATVSRSSTDVGGAVAAVVTSLLSFVRAK